MKENASTYHRNLILSVILLILNGMSSAWGQSPATGDSLSDAMADTITAVMADTVTTAATDTITAFLPDTITVAATQTDSNAVAVAAPDTALLDTMAIGLKSDSLLQHIPRAEKRFIPNPQRALWLSLIIPGAGQIYNRKLWKIPIVYGGFLGCLYALTWNNQMLSDYSQAYLDIMDDDPNTKSYENMLPLNYSIEGREEQYQEIFKNKKNYYRRYRDMSIFAMIGVYLLSVVDAYVDAELSSFDISRDLSLQVEPTIFNFGGRRQEASVGIQCNINF